MSMVTYPLNDADYQAEDAELFHCTRNSGIYAGNDFACSCTGADNILVIGPGVGWIRNSRFSGKVIALKAEQAIDMGLTDSVYPRIDAVVLQFDANSNQTEVKVKKGTPSSVPAAPEISRTESVYELHLYHVYREAGAVSLSVADITDLRMDTNYCGLMADSVTKVDTSAINAQVMALVEKLRQEILAVKDGNAYISLIVSDIKPERKNTLWFDTSRGTAASGIALLSLDEDETGAAVMADVDGETYGVENATVNAGASGSNYDFTVL